MKFKVLLSTLAGAALLLIAGASQAFVLTPGDCVASTCWTTTDNSNPDANAIESLVGASVDLTLMYKANVGGSDEGGFADSYNTIFSNSATDPKDATITYISGPVITCPTCYLSVKGGRGTPSLYVFDISYWNGMEDDIELRNFWPDQNAISNVAIWSDSRSVPEPAALALFGLGLVGLSAMRRKRK